MTAVTVRVLSYHLPDQRDDELVSVIRAAEPDILVVQEAPRRLRWRTKNADLAHRCGLLYAAGGLPGLGNAVYTTHRVAVPDNWSVRFPLTPGKHLRGAIAVRCVVGRTPFVVLGTHLDSDPAERPAQAALVRKALTDADAPVIVAGDLNEASGGAAWRTIGDGLTDAGDGGRQQVIFVDPVISVRRYEKIEGDAAVLAELEIPA